MLSPLDSVSEGIMFLGKFVYLFVHSFLQILLPWYVMYLLIHTDELIRVWKSKVEVTAGHQDDIHIDTVASKSI